MFLPRRPLSERRRTHPCWCALLSLAWCLATLTPAMLAPTVALAAPAERAPAVDATPKLGTEMVARLAQRNLREVEAAVNAIAATGDARALPLLRALSDRHLYRGEDGRILIGSSIDQANTLQLTDPLSGAQYQADADGVDEIRVSNRVRRALRTAISTLALTTSDAGARRVAAERFLADPDPDLREALETALAREAEPDIHAALQAARAALLLMDGNTSTTDLLAAVDRLAANASQDARNALANLREDVTPAVLQARDAALRRIDRVQAQWAFAENVWFGLSLGSVLLLAALGLAITFGVMGVINMAHGEMVMLGAYTTFAVQQAVNAVAPGLMAYSLLLALPAAFAVTALLGVGIERTVIRRLYHRPLDTLLATWGVSLLLQQSVRTLFGATNRPVETVSWMDGAFALGGLSITYSRLYILLFSLAVLVVLMAVMQRTRLGLEIRAVMQNRAMAEAVGIRSERVDMVTFALGSGIAGIAGVALSQIDNVSPNLGQSYIIDSFMVIVFGGVGNLLGTFFGAMALGVTSKAAEPWIGAVAAKVLILVVIIGFIQFRPRGLFPQRGRAAEGS